MQAYRRQIIAILLGLAMPLVLFIVFATTRLPPQNACPGIAGIPCKTF